MNWNPTVPDKVWRPVVYTLIGVCIAIGAWSGAMVGIIAWNILRV